MREYREQSRLWDYIVGHSRVERQILASAAMQVCEKRKKKKRETHFTLPIVCRTQKAYCLSAKIKWQSLATNLVVNKAITLTKKINMIIYLKNLIVGLHSFYILNIIVRFYVNMMLFTVWFINLFFMHNFRLQKFKI